MRGSSLRWSNRSKPGAVASIAPVSARASSRCASIAKERTIQQRYWRNSRATRTDRSADRVDPRMGGWRRKSRRGERHAASRGRSTDPPHRYENGPKSLLITSGPRSNSFRPNGLCSRARVARPVGLLAPRRSSILNIGAFKFSIDEVFFHIDPETPRHVHHAPSRSRT